MESQNRERVEKLVAAYRERLEQTMLKNEQELKTLSDMEEEVSRVSQQANQRLLEEMLALKKTAFRKKR